MSKVEKTTEEYVDDLKDFLYGFKNMIESDEENPEIPDPSEFVDAYIEEHSK